MQVSTSFSVASDSHCSGHKDSTMIPMGLDHSRTPKDWPQKIIVELDIHPGLSFPTGGTMGSEETPRCGAVPAWERSSVVNE